MKTEITVTKSQQDRVKKILQAKLNKPGMEEYLTNDDLFNYLYQDVFDEVIMSDMLIKGEVI